MTRRLPLALGTHVRATRSATREFQGRRRCAAARTLAVLVSVSVLVAGCGGGGSSSGVAALKGSHSKPASSSSGGGDVVGTSSPSSGIGASGVQLLRFARCARSHGAPNFPDPNSQGEFVGVAAGSPELQTADAHCSKYLPAPTPTTGAEPHFIKEINAYAACMHQHNEPDYPEMTPSGTDRWTMKLPSGVLDPNSPIFQRATATCDKLVGPPPPGSVPSAAPAS
jgi:hypothetical protein